jgi:hypothetical protein
VLRPNAEGNKPEHCVDLFDGETLRLGGGTFGISNLIFKIRQMDNPPQKL